MMEGRGRGRRKREREREVRWGRETLSGLRDGKSTREVESGVVDRGER
jgi:hypothetical protein